MVFIVMSLCKEEFWCSCNLTRQEEERIGMLSYGDYNSQ